MVGLGMGQHDGSFLGDGIDGNTERGAVQFSLDGAFRQPHFTHFLCNQKTSLTAFLRIH